LKHSCTRLISCSIPTAAGVVRESMEIFCQFLKCICRPAGGHRDGGIRVTSGVLLRHWYVQHGRTLHRKELEQAQVRGGMSPSGDLRGLQPQEQ